jgi:hypothetical protein
MVARKYSASMDEDLLAEVKQAADEEDETLSAFLAEAARERVRLLGLHRVLQEWQDENGAFTEEELAEAAAWLDSARDPQDILREIEAEEAEKATKKPAPRKRKTA